MGYQNDAIIETRPAGSFTQNPPLGSLVATIGIDAALAVIDLGRADRRAYTTDRE